MQAVHAILDAHRFESTGQPMPQPKRDRLMELAQQGAYYEFAPAAEAYLQHCPDDSMMRELCALSYARLGLAGAAQRIAAATYAAPLSAMVEAALPRQNHRLSWGALERRYRTNLALFGAKTGLAADVDAALRAIRSKLDLFLASDGSPQVYCRLSLQTSDAPSSDAAAVIGWLPNLAPHSSINLDDMARTWRGSILTTLAINGVGLGFGVERVYEASRDTFLGFSAPLIVFEPSLVAWAVVMHLHDWEELLSSPRVTICAGSDALTRFETELTNTTRSVPVVLRFSPPWPHIPSTQPDFRPATDSDLIERVKAESKRRDDAHASAFRRACAASADMDDKAWRARFDHDLDPDRPLTVLALTTRYSTVLQYAARDALAAFERAGFDTHLYIEPNHHSQYSRLRLAEMVADTRPDLILLLDHLRAEYKDIFPPGIPGITWIQDCLPNLHNPDAGRAVLPLEFVIGHSASYLVTDFCYPDDRVFPCSIPTNPEALQDRDGEPVDMSPYSCDVMFATHAPEYATIEARFEAVHRELDEVGKRFAQSAFDEIRDLLASRSMPVEYDCDELLCRVEQRIGLQVKDPSTRASFSGLFRGILDQQIRIRAIRAAASWADAAGGRFNLYGSGWERFHEFARFARGPLKHGVELGRAFRGAKVSLHAGCNYSFHQRVLDGLCAGGFLLLPRRLSECYIDVYEAMADFAGRFPAAKQRSIMPEDLDHALRTRFEALLAAFGMPPERGLSLSPVWRVCFKMLFEQKSALFAARVWPQYDRVTYADEAELTRKIDQFVHADDERCNIAREMRQAVLRHFTYDALIENVMRFIRSYFRGERVSLAPS